MLQITKFFEANFIGYNLVKIINVDEAKEIDERSARQMAM